MLNAGAYCWERATVILQTVILEGIVSFTVVHRVHSTPRCYKK